MQGRNSLSGAGEGSLTLVAPPGVKYPICPLVTAWSRDWGMAKGGGGGEMEEWMEERASWRGQGVGVNPHSNSGGVTFQG